MPGTARAAAFSVGQRTVLVVVDKCREHAFEPGGSVATQCDEGCCAGTEDTRLRFELAIEQGVGGRALVPVTRSTGDVPEPPAWSVTLPPQFTVSDRRDEYKCYAQLVQLHAGRPTFARTWTDTVGVVRIQVVVPAALEPDELSLVMCYLSDVALHDLQRAAKAATSFRRHQGGAGAASTASEPRPDNDNGDAPRSSEVAQRAALPPCGDLLDQLQALEEHLSAWEVATGAAERLAPRKRMWDLVEAPGRVALVHVAVMLGCTNVLKRLVALGADTTRRCDHGTPLDIALVMNARRASGPWVECIRVLVCANSPSTVGPALLPATPSRHALEVQGRRRTDSAACSASHSGAEVQHSPSERDDDLLACMRSSRQPVPQDVRGSWISTDVGAGSNALEGLHIGGAQRNDVAEPSDQGHDGARSKPQPASGVDSDNSATLPPRVRSHSEAGVDTRADSGTLWDALAVGAVRGLAMSSDKVLTCLHRSPPPPSPTRPCQPGCGNKVSGYRRTTTLWHAPTAT